MSIDGFPSIGDQKSYINANLGSTMMLTFLMGIYTAVYTATLYLYLSRKGPMSLRNLTVSCTITLLYCICLGIFGLEWYCLRRAVVEGDTREAIFIATNQIPPGVYLTLAILQFLLFAVSDGLLIWRCFLVWNKSLRMIILPFFLLVVEIGLAISISVLSAKLVFLGPTPNAIMIDKLQTAELFISFGTTIITTFLIGYRIYTTSRLTGIAATSMGRFKHIMTILIESAAIYSIVILINAVYILLDYDPFSAVDISDFYVQIIVPFVGGMAPTIAVARLAAAHTENNQTSENVAISALKFHVTRNASYTPRDESYVSESGEAFPVQLEQKQA